MFKDKFYIPQNFIDDIIREYHDFRGHFGHKRTLDMLSRHFYFERMAHHV